MIKNISMPWITVSSMEKAKKLFVTIMGFKIHEENLSYNWVELECNATYLGIFEQSQKGNIRDLYSINKNIDFPGQNAVLTFAVDSIELAVEVMKNNDIQCSPIMSIEGVFKMTTFFDFDNNKFQLYEKN